MYAQINPFKLQYEMADTSNGIVKEFYGGYFHSHVDKQFFDACCEFFNKLEALLRKVNIISARDSYFRLGERCLDGVWRLYGELISKVFSESQRSTMQLLTD